MFGSAPKTFQNEPNQVPWQHRLFSIPDEAQAQELPTGHAFQRASNRAMTAHPSARVIDPEPEKVPPLYPVKSPNA